MSDSGVKERSAALNFVYNPETGAWFTRTPSSWLKIGLFYLVYYSGLAAFFAGMLAIFVFAFTDDTAPVLTGGYSVLPPNPGMGFRPMPDIEKTMIKYSMASEKTIRPYVNDIKYFLKPNDTDYNYMQGQDSGKYSNCSDPSTTAATHNDLPCDFKVTEMEDVTKHCLHKGDYGYAEGQPCVIVKLNKIFEFIPKLKGKTDYLQIHCEGEHPADKDNIGPVNYYPKDGFDMKYFPYLNQPNYLSPIVFVKFEKPTLGVLIQVVCKPINADNIEQNKYMRGDGRVHFELLIDQLKPKED